jgi:hypothetical protein
MKAKARKSKMKIFNVVKLRKCENHRFMLGYFYYEYADKSEMRKAQRLI